ncbi:TPA: hypothetical protein IAD52_08395 [Candidatus Spyradomonas excrementavium]|nr:hypothetical protein [Candidatus Spyradomonas excrementavium]
MNLVSLISNALMPTNINAVQGATAQRSSNPFGNPFISDNATNYYGKNKPVRGGYFAGYYNGKPNIVGKRLFLEV